MPGNTRLFQESITQELDSIKNRVRNLLGDAHWGEEGRFKEAVLKNVLRKFLPSNLSVGTGFILKAEGESDNENVHSRQLDIIIYDNTKPVLFSEGDFIITTTSNVRGIVEVKSKITANTFVDVIQQFDNSISDFITEFNEREERIFAGIFAFTFEGNIDSSRIEDELFGSRHIVNHISLGSNYFIRKWKHEDRNRLAVPVECPGDFYNYYELINLSFSYFIANMVDITCGGLNDRYWFSFPIEGTKEIHRRKTVCL